MYLYCLIRSTQIVLKVDEVVKDKKKNDLFTQKLCETLARPRSKNHTLDHKFNKSNAEISTHY